MHPILKNISRFSLITAIGLILLINALHAFWNLAFSSWIVFLIFKALLVLVAVKAMIANSNLSLIKLIIKRLSLTVSFVLLLGIPKFNINFQPFFGKFEVACICYESVIDMENNAFSNRIEVLEKTTGFYDTTTKCEFVQPFLLLFEWRTIITYSNPLLKNFTTCEWKIWRGG